MRNEGDDDPDQALASGDPAALEKAEHETLAIERVARAIEASRVDPARFWAGRTSSAKAGALAAMASAGVMAACAEPEPELPPRPPTAMDEPTAASALAALNGATADHPAGLVGDPWPEVYCGNVTFAITGWTVVVFNDCMSWDYIDSMTAPDGRSWDYDDLPEQVRFWTPASLAGWPTVSFDRDG